MHWSIGTIRTYLALIERLWPGWSFEWAYEGILDIAAYVDYPRDRLLGTKTRIPRRDAQWVVSMTRTDGTLRIALIDPERTSFTDFLPNGYEIYLPFDEVLAHRDALIHYVNVYGQEYLSFLARNPFEVGGVHIDMPSRIVSVWTKEAFNIVEKAQPHWEGWQVVWLRDAFEAHVMLTQGRLDIKLYPIEQRLEWLYRVLLKDTLGVDLTFSQRSALFFAASRGLII